MQANPISTGSRPATFEGGEASGHGIPPAAIPSTGRHTAGQQVFQHMQTLLPTGAGPTYSILPPAATSHPPLHYDPAKYGGLSVSPHQRWRRAQQLAGELDTSLQGRSAADIAHSRQLIEELYPLIASLSCRDAQPIVDDMLASLQRMHLRRDDPLEYKVSLRRSASFGANLAQLQAAHPALAGGDAADTPANWPEDSVFFAAQQVIRQKGEHGLKREDLARFDMSVTGLEILKSVLRRPQQDQRGVASLCRYISDANQAIEGDLNFGQADVIARYLRSAQRDGHGRIPVPRPEHLVDLGLDLKSSQTATTYWRPLLWPGENFRSQIHPDTRRLDDHLNTCAPDTFMPVETVAAATGVDSKRVRQIASSNSRYYGYRMDPETRRIEISRRGQVIEREPIQARIVEVAKPRPQPFSTRDLQGLGWDLSSDILSRELSALAAARVPKVKTSGSGLYTLTPAAWADDTATPPVTHASRGSPPDRDDQPPRKRPRPN